MMTSRAAIALAVFLVGAPYARAQLFPTREQLLNRQQQAQPAPVNSQTPYAPPLDGRAPAPAQQPQSFFPQNFRSGEKPAAVGEGRTTWQDHRGASERPPVETRAPVEVRTPTPELRTQIIGPSPFPAPDPRDPLQVERRNALNELRNPPAPLNETRYLDYKLPDRAPYDYRPPDYKPVDARASDYKSQDNKTPDQRVLDPRLKEKGPEIQARIDCRAILYKAAECNFLDYRDPDPKLLELAAKFPEISIGIVPKELTKDSIDRWTPLVNHLSREIGLKLTLKVANDYQSLLESQRAGLVHIAVYSPLSFARARLTGSKIEAFAVETGADGSRGSSSVVYSMARGPNPRVEDLKGKSIGLVDPNSMTGFNVPRFAFSSQKLDPETFLGKQIFTGSHENALLALSQGLVDLAVGEWRSDEDSTLARLLAKGQLKNVDGTPMRRDDFRIVLKSEPVMNAPIAYLADLPEDLKAMLRRAMLEAPMRDRAAFERIFDGKGRTWEPVDTRTFDGTVELLRFMDESRKRRAS